MSLYPHGHPPIPGQGPELNFGRGDFHQLSGNGWFTTGGNVHDTFHVDPSGHISGFHTTVDLGGGQKLRLDHNDFGR